MSSFRRALLVAVVVALLTVGVPVSSTSAAGLPVPEVRISKVPKACRVTWVPALRGSVRGVSLASTETVTVKFMRLKHGDWLYDSECKLGLRLVDGAMRYHMGLPLRRGFWRIRVTIPARAGKHAAARKEIRVRVVRRRIVALTFDDGPSPRYTKRVRAVLDTYNAPATFFMLGGSVNRYPRTARAVAADPLRHEVANHSYSHPMMGGWSAARIRAQVSRCQRACRGIMGVTPKYFRPPGRSTSTTLRRTVSNMGLTVMMWTVDPQDWRSPGAGAIYRRVVGGTRNRSVIILHDGGASRSGTVAALPRIITTLRARGYDFVTLDEMAAIRAAEKAAAR